MFVRIFAESIRQNVLFINCLYITHEQHVISINTNIMKDTKMSDFDIAVKRLSNRKEHDKSSLFYILKCVNHKKYFYTYEQSYTRDQILNFVIVSITVEENFNKLLKLNTFRDLNN